MTHFTISQASQAAGLPPKTIRFYESEGIISPPPRAENGYRSYSAAAVEELKLLKQLRDLGLPLSETKKLLRGCGGNRCRHSEEYVESVIVSYQDTLLTKIQELTTLRDKLETLRSKMAQYRETGDERVFCCDIFHQLLVTNKNKEVPMAPCC